MTDEELNILLKKHYKYIKGKDELIEFSKSFICINLKDMDLKVNDMRRIKDICKFIRNHMAKDDTRIIMDSFLRFYVTPQEYKKMPKDAQRCPYITI